MKCGGQKAGDNRVEMKKRNRVARTLVSLLLMVMLSCTSVLAEEPAQAGQTETQTGTQTQTESQAKTPEPAPSRIFKKGKNYYYRKANGKIRKKAGFVKDNGNLYYVRKGGKIARKKTFKVKKKQYRAYSNGIIATGVYVWNGKYYYSKPSTGQWIKKEKLVSWNGSTYYVMKGGVVLRNDAFAYKNLPYVADEAGRVSALPIPDGGGNPVVKVAKEQVGIMTGKTYWRWYFGTKFRDTDRTPWCGAFVAWVYNAAGQYEKITEAKKFGNLGYVPSYSRYADKHNKWVNRAEAQPGDVIVFGRNRHVGLVEGVIDGYIYTIEGNAGPTAALGCGKPGAVCRKVYKLSDSDIKGVIHP